ncbi:MAG: penicillin-binding transpeptidase domain-containing protein [Candidatus Goldiibacteriota bacterium]
MIRKKPIGHLSSRNYKKKNYTLLYAVVLIIAAAGLLFYFSGKNIHYMLLVKSGAKNISNSRLTYAISDFNKALNIKPGGAVAIDGLGAVYLRQGDKEKAIKFYTEALAAGLKLNKTLRHTAFGEYYLERGLYDRAQLEFEHAVRLNKVDYKALYGLGSCMHASGNIDAAISYYTKALTYNPKFTPARKNLSLAEDDRNKGAMYYLFDRNGEPLARYNLISSQSKKYYLMDHRTAHITGYDADGKLTGLEKHLKDYIPGNKIYLTIDSKVQQTIANAMGWYKGSIVVLHPKTGEILGMYSQPTFRPNNMSDSKYRRSRSLHKNKPLLNRAADKLFEPGSIVKLITLAAAYEYGIKEEDIFPIRCAGSTVFNDKAFWCWSTHGKVDSIKKTMAESCNIGMAFIGFELGSGRLFEYNSRFGFGEPFDLGFNDTLRNTQISIPTAASKVPAQIKNRFEMAMYSCGLSPNDDFSYMLTPLHAALISATIANNGVMMNPYLIKEIRNINGKLIYKAENEVLRNPVSASTARKLNEIMVYDVENKNATGYKAGVKGLSIAGKTGTSGGGKGLNAWFISFADSKDPEYALAIVGDSEGQGMHVAAPIAAEIYKRILEP